MKSQILFGVFFSLLVLSVVSAQLQLTPLSVPSTTQPNRDVTVTFNVVNSAEALSNLSWSMSSTSIGTWKTLPTLSTLNANETRSLAAVLNVPAGASGTISASVKVVSGSQEATLPITITISNTPTLTLAKLKELTLSQSGMINVSNTGNTLFSNINLSASGTLPVLFSENNFQVPVGSSKAIDVALQTTSTVPFGSYPITITARDLVQNTVATTTFTIDKSFCRSGAVGSNLSIENVDFSSSGDEDDIWKPLDEVDIDVEVENRGDDDVREVTIELGLFDSDGTNVADDLDFSTADEEKMDIGTLNDGDSEEVTFSFRVPADFEVGDYKLAVKVYSDRTGESNECMDRASDLDSTTFQEISVEGEDDEGKFIAFDNIELNPETATCGDSVSLRVDTFNIGEDDQDQVRVNLANRALGLALSEEIRSDLDVGDKQSVSFLFTIPADAEDGTFDLALSSEYDYRNGNYRESSDENAIVKLRVAGCGLTGGSGTGTPGRFTAITASLESEAAAGKELMVSSRITNLLTTDATFVIDADGYDSWAELTDISDRSLSLDAGESAEVTFTFMINDDASEEESFSIVVESGQQSEEREVSVAIAQSATGSSISFGGNGLIWIIGIINVVLIVLIILVAIRISRR